MLSQFLLMGGESADLMVGLELFADQICQSGPLLFVPHALPPGNHQEYHSLFCTLFEKLGVANDQIHMWDDSLVVNQDTVSTFSAIYFGGGNTFRLLDTIRRSRLSKVLMSFVASGKYVAGNSAGAIIFGKDIIHAHDSNSVGLVDCQGIDQIGGYTIWCHYDAAYHDWEIQEYLLNIGHPVLAIPNNGTLLIEGNLLKVVGPGIVWCINRNDRRPIKPGECIALKPDENQT